MSLYAYDVKSIIIVLSLWIKQLQATNYSIQRIHLQIFEQSNIPRLHYTQLDTKLTIMSAWIPGCDARKSVELIFVLNQSFIKTSWKVFTELK